LSATKLIFFIANLLVRLNNRSQVKFEAQLFEEKLKCYRLTIWIINESLSFKLMSEN